MEKDTKKKLFALCKENIQNRISELQEDLQDLKDAGTESTKSSAGDKYETEAAMLHLENEKVGQQLMDAIRLRSALDKIPIEAKHDVVKAGSLIKTNEGNFFISVFLGKFDVEGEIFMTISLSSPLGKVLEGARVGDKVQFRDKVYQIQEIF